MTKTYATLVVTRATFDEIHSKLKAANYDHAIVGNPAIRVNLDEIGLMTEDEFEPKPKPELTYRGEPITRGAAQNMLDPSFSQYLPQDQYEKLWDFATNSV